MQKDSTRNITSWKPPFRHYIETKIAEFGLQINLATGISNECMKRILKTHLNTFQTACCIFNTNWWALQHRRFIWDDIILSNISTFWKLIQRFSRVLCANFDSLFSFWYRKIFVNTYSTSVRLSPVWCAWRGIINKWKLCNLLLVHNIEQAPTYDLP